MQPPGIPTPAVIGFSMFTHTSLAEEIAAANRRLMDIFKQNDAVAAGACYTEDA